jgi:hypothetical protein
MQNNEPRGGDEHGGLVRDGFVCPICAYDAYCRIIVKRADHSRYVTQFYRCGGCQVMFHNPRTFSADPQSLRRRPLKGGTPRP